jgi:hypothetical protein
LLPLRLWNFFGANSHSPRVCKNHSAVCDPIILAAVEYLVAQGLARRAKPPT